jgi:hypothetical protein
VNAMDLNLNPMNPPDAEPRSHAATRVNAVDLNLNLMNPPDAEPRSHAAHALNHVGVRCSPIITPVRSRVLRVQRSRSLRMKARVDMIRCLVRPSVAVDPIVLVTVVVHLAVL